MAVGLECPVAQQRVGLADDDVFQRAVVFDIHHRQHEAAVTERGDAPGAVKFRIAHRTGYLYLRFYQPLYGAYRRQVSAQQFIDVQLFDRGVDLQFRTREGFSRFGHLYPAFAGRLSVEEYAVRLFDQDLPRSPFDRPV